MQQAQSRWYPGHGGPDSGRPWVWRKDWRFNSHTEGTEGVWPWASWDRALDLRSYLKPGCSKAWILYIEGSPTTQKSSKETASAQNFGSKEWWSISPEKYELQAESSMSSGLEVIPCEWHKSYDRELIFPISGLEISKIT